MKDIHSLTAEYFEKILTYRREIHAHPELSKQERQTSAMIARVLREIGIETTENVGGYGVVGLIRGSREGRCIALRADIDALPIPENTGLPFASKNEGVSHSCGHDTHTAMLLGAAHILYELREELSGCVKLIFQPAEENVMDCGAVPMIRDGVLENPHVDAVIGQHVWPQYLTGSAAIRCGAMMASSDKFYITVRGKSSHGSAPEDGIDAIAIAAQVVTALQTIVSRSVSPLDSAVVTIGVIEGGNRYNVIADEVRMEGTCRNLNPTVRNAMSKRMERIIRGVTEGMGGSYEFRYCNGYAPTVNDPGMFELVYGEMKEMLGDNAVIPENSALGGEDFSFFCEQRPSAYYWLGCRKPDSDFYPLHNGCFAPDEDALLIGTELMARCAVKFLNQ